MKSIVAILFMAFAYALVAIAQVHVDSTLSNTITHRNVWPNPTLQQMETVYLAAYFQQLKDTMFLLRPKQSFDMVVDGRLFSVKYDTTFGLANKRTTRWIATYFMDTTVYRDTMTLPYTTFGEPTCDGKVPVPSDSVYKGWTVSYSFYWDRPGSVSGDTIRVREVLHIVPVKLVNADANIQAQIKTIHYELPVLKYQNDTIQTVPILKTTVGTGKLVPLLAMVATSQRSQVVGMTVEQVAAVRDNPEVLLPNNLFRNASYRRAMGWRPVDEQKAYNNDAMKAYKAGDYMSISPSQEVQQRQQAESMRKFYELKAKARDEFLKRQREAMQDTSRH